MAEGSVPEELGFGINTNEEVVAAGGTTNTLVKNPAAGTLTALAALSGMSGVGHILVRAATPAVDDPSTAAQPNWYIPLVAADS